MLKIARIVGSRGSIATLKLEGKLLGPWVEELSRAWVELEVPPSDLCLDLSAVTFIDPAGIRLIGELLRQGATISECTGFVEELLGVCSLGAINRGPGGVHPATPAVPIPGDH